MTSFAINVWIYQQTHSTQRLAWMVLAATLPGILGSPLAGAAADRWDRRWIMVFSSIGAGLSTLFIAASFFWGSTHMWHIYLGVGGISFFAAFQLPACIAASSMLIPREHYARASGLWQFAQAITLIAAPPMAVVLVPWIGIQGVVLGDFVTYLVAIAVLLTVRIPKPEAVVVDHAGKPSLLREIAVGWAYIRDRRGLAQLMAFSFIVLFAISMTQVLLVPLVLNVASVKALAVVISAATIGMVIGSVAMASWGGPQRRIMGVLGSAFVLGVALFLTGFQRGPALIALGLFVLGCVAPMGVGCAQDIWQSKTDPAVQGRVFALRGMLNQACLPMACLLAGPLADKVFNPLLATGGWLAIAIGRVSVAGPGGGVGLLMTLMGILSIAAASLGWFSPRFRRVEKELPDVVVHVASVVEMGSGAGEEIAEFAKVV
jgi:MFS transporter, DHA3 family, macrolide efflux protein